ncbi:glycosyltransferase 87 family protein [Acidipila sp. EB88]|uniref:glycosyltransferase 87 family protein n=1 Tax=Acidipila sp. EB88 TaxID=2305226 RepID=UPI0013150F61|nr:glycosyltransferase 87 family protein [Acidipila sp. EB88]
MLSFVTKHRPWVTAACCLTFLLAGLVTYWNQPGADLSSSYVGCRLVATGNTAVLYSHDPEDFADIGDAPIWKRLALAGQYSGYLHPYVQTPLWAYSLQPLCDHTQFPVFNRVFLVLILAALIAAIWVTARAWLPMRDRSWLIAVVLLGLWFAQPFQYAMYLMQTHALFFALMVISLVLAERGRPRSAGLLLALASAVKVTPAMLLLYWLLRRRWQAAASMIICSAVLLLLTVVLAGPHLTAAYFADLHRVSRVLLVSQNNQSFAAWCMGRFFPADEVFDLNIYPLPGAVRLGSLALMLLTIASGAMLDVRSSGTRAGEAKAAAPLGAMMALVAVTLFAPIAWTHYSIVLVAPVMVLMGELRSRFKWATLLGTLGTVALNYQPIATDIIAMDVGDYSLVRAQFYAGALCLATLGWAAVVRRRGVRVDAQETALHSGRIASVRGSEAD